MKRYCRLDRARKIWSGVTNIQHILCVLYVRPFFNRRCRYGQCIHRSPDVLSSHNLNKLLDASIFFSFDQSGIYQTCPKYKTEDLNVDCSGKNYLITGANSGLGKATAIEIAHRGGTVSLVEMNSAPQTHKMKLSKKQKIQIYISNS